MFSISKFRDFTKAGDDYHEDVLFCLTNPSFTVFYSSYINLTKLKELPGTSTSHLSEPAELRTYTYVNFTEDDMMLRQDVIADDVTTPVTNYKRGYVDFAETMNHNEDHTGEGRFSRDYKSESQLSVYF